MRRAGLLAVLGLVIVCLGADAVPALAVTPQSASIQSVSPGYAAVHISGTVDPGDEDATWWAETSTDNITWSGYPGAFGEFAAHTGPHAVEVEVNDEKGDPTKFLQGEQRYYVRLVVSNGAALTFSSSPNPFTNTLPVDAPAVLTVNNAAEVTYTTAKVSGTVERPANPAPAFNANCGFEYVIHAQFIATGFKTASRVPCTTSPVTTPGSNPANAELTGLKPGGTYHLRLTAANAGGTRSLVAASTFTTTAITPPTVTISSPVLGAGTSAHFSGSINPQLGPAAAGLYEVDWHFVCTPKCLDSNGQQLSGTPIPPDNSSHPVSADVTLEPNTEYQVRLVAANAGETATAGPTTVATPAFPPIARTLGVSATAESAVLGAKVNPFNSPVTYQFEWGLTDSYGNLVPAAAESLSRADNAFHYVTASLPGLSPGTAYHYRVVATNTQIDQESAGADRTFTTPAVPGPTPACLNDSSRVGTSANLPDCRAYEFVTPNLNGSAPTAGWPGLAVDGVRADGGAIAFVSGDAPEDAEGSTSVANTLLAQRGGTGWTTKSLSAGTPNASGTNFGSRRSTVGLSGDLSQSVLWTNQPLAGSGSPSGTNLYLRRGDGTVVALTKVGAAKFTEGGGLSGASQDFTRLFIVSTVKQIQTDPVAGGNTYEWSGENLQLVTILPGAAKEAAPAGGSVPQGALPSVSDDGHRVLFKATGLPGLYLRLDGERTVEVSASKRTTDPDPNPTASAISAGLAADGSTVLFTSASELTDEANTGETAGQANDQGSDLYSYDVATDQLIDLTIDEDPADVGAGADVERVVGASRDASYVYFIARGKLAEGGTSGERNLYVEHGGAIDFVGSNPTGDESQGYPFYVTPDGQHAAFMATEGQTGYDTAGQSEVYKFTYGAGLECASCRPSGEVPSGGASIAGRALSDDGSRLFFQSTDAVVPQAQSGLSNVFEYAGGAVRLLTPGDGLTALLAGASASGDDVFIATFEKLSPRSQGAAFAIYDARVNADVPPPPAPSVCQGESCRGTATAAQQLASPGTAKFESPGTVAAPKSKTVAGSKAKLRLTVPESGELSIVGRGIKPLKESAAGTVNVTVALTKTADKRRLRKGSFKTTAEVLFTSPAGSLSRAEVTLKFTAGSQKKGGK